MAETDPIDSNIDDIEDFVSFFKRQKSKKLVDKLPENFEATMEQMETYLAVMKAAYQDAMQEEGVKEEELSTEGISEEDLKSIERIRALKEELIGIRDTLKIALEAAEKEKKKPKKKSPIVKALGRKGWKRM